MVRAICPEELNKTGVSNIVIDRHPELNRTRFNANHLLADREGRRNGSRVLCGWWKECEGRMEDLARQRNLLTLALCEGTRNSVTGSIQYFHLTVRVFLFANILVSFFVFYY